MSTQTQQAPAPTTVDSYLSGIIDQYQRSTYLGDLTCMRMARIAMCREIRKTTKTLFTYRQASAMLVQKEKP